MKQSAIVRFFIISLTVMAIGGCAKAPAPAVQSGAIPGKISFITGEVKVNDKNAAVGMPISEGDVITTKGDESLCEFFAGEKNIFQLKGDGRLVYRFSEKSPAFEISSGWLAGLARSKKLLKDDFLVKSPTITAAIRGTAFCMKVEKPESVYFCTCNGTIELADREGKNRHLESYAHHGSKRYRTDKTGAVIVENGGMHYHDDTTINALAKKLNVSVDWKKPHQGKE